VFQADPAMASQFVNLVLRNAANGQAPAAPPDLQCSTEETVDGGRLDLRFRASGWDVIIELKIDAGYGGDQLTRYLNVLSEVDCAYLAAITRSVPTYGEPAGIDPRWLGSVQWRRLLPELRAMQVSDSVLDAQWPLFLDVLEAEGSMGFTKPEPRLFEALTQLRQSSNHVAEFVRAVQVPLYDKLLDALGGDESAASIYKTSCTVDCTRGVRRKGERDRRKPHDRSVPGRVGISGAAPRIPCLFEVAQRSKDGLADVEAAPGRAQMSIS